MKDLLAKYCQRTAYGTIKIFLIRFSFSECSKNPQQRHQPIRCNMERVSMSVGYRSQNVTGSDICLGAALGGLRGPKANTCLHEWKVTPDRLMPGTWHELLHKAGSKISFTGPDTLLSECRSLPLRVCTYSTSGRTLYSLWCLFRPRSGRR